MNSNKADHYPLTKPVLLARSPTTSTLLQPTVNCAYLSYPHYRPHLIKRNSFFSSWNTFHTWSPRYLDFLVLNLYSWLQLLSLFYWYLCSLISTTGSPRTQCLAGSSSLLRLPLLVASFELVMLNAVYAWMGPTCPALAWMATLRNAQLSNWVCNIASWMLSLSILL